ncbi:MAG: alpha-amylase family glycosyl hydrolase [bacterium]|nr:alpha-amylase family glycosyl hydrolase [bacterium]
MKPRIIVREIHLLEAVLRFPPPSGKQPSLDYIPDEVLDYWCQKPFTHIWAMGAWRRSLQSKTIALQHPFLQKEFNTALPDWTEKDVYGSPYAIFSYEPSRSLGSKQAFYRFRKRLSDRGVGLILDFVPNHLAVDHPWVYSSPQRFVMRSNVNPDEEPPLGWFGTATTFGKCWIAHGKDPYFPSWTDTAQLDYRKSETRKAMINVLFEISEFCDGVRCDMAMLILNSIFRKTWGDWDGETITNEFWSSAIDQVHRVRPSFLWIAEAYWGLENKLIELGFDWVYDKEFTTRVIQRNGNELRTTLFDKRLWGQRYLRFLENHDEPRIAEQLPKESLEVATSLLFMQPGGVLWNDGQELGSKVKLPIQLTRRPKETLDLDLVQRLQRILEIYSTLPHHTATKIVLDVRPVSDFESSHQWIIPILWISENKTIVWIGNISKDVSMARIPLHLSGIADRMVRFTDLRTGEIYERDGNEVNTIGLFVRLTGNDFHWFEVEILPRG